MLSRVRARALESAFIPRRMSLREWGAMDEDEDGELVDGVLQEEEMPTYLHEVVVRWLIVLLDAWARRRRGSVVGSEAKIAVGPRRGRKPDLSIFFAPDVPSAEDAVIRVAPHTVIEVISKRPRDARGDRVEKLRDYARAGVRFYWLVDPGVRTFEVLELSRGRYVHAADASAGRVRIRGCAGLAIDLDELWGEVTRVEAGSHGKARQRRRR